MTILEIIVLAILQGLTEFLPVSSSGHLILVPGLLGWSDQGLAFDVAVHFGTLAAVVTYFRVELTRMTFAFFGQANAQRSDEQRHDVRLAWLIILATIPVGLVGIGLHDFIEQHLRSPIVIAATTAVFGVLLWLAAKLGNARRDEQGLGLKDALIIGIAQALALVPGTSRSGITITAALGLGFNAHTAARFSFLLSIPVIVLAAGLETMNLLEQTGPIDWRSLLLGTSIAAIVAYLTIKYFLRFIQTIGMLPFMLYRLALAGLILYVLA